MTARAATAPLAVNRVADERDAAHADTRLAGALFFVVGAAFLTVIMLGASIAPGYDYNAAAISDLGVIDQTALLFNAMLVTIGALNIVGSYLFYRAHRRAWLLAVSVLGGLGAAGAGVMPLDTGGLHSLFALVGFVFFNVQAAGTTAVVAGPMRLVALAGGAIGLVYVVVMVIGDAGNPAVFGPIGHGGTERMIAYPTMLAFLALGGYLMAHARPRG